MEIIIRKRDAMVLLFSMDVMKKNVSSNFRSREGIRKGKQMMKTFKSIIKLLDEKLIVNDEEDDKLLCFCFDEEQHEMVKEFISTYMDLLEERALEDDADVMKNAWYPSLENWLYSLLIAEKELVIA